MLLLIAWSCRSEAPPPGATAAVDDTCANVAAPYGPATILDVEDRLLGAVDWDLDGDVDVALRGGWPPVSLHENLGDGVFGPKQELLRFGASDSEFVPLGFRDMDRDEDADLVSSWRSSWTHPDNVTLLWWENEGALPVSWELISVLDEAPLAGADCEDGSLHLVDVDSDGDDDLTCATARPSAGDAWVLGDLQWFEQTEEGDFEIPPHALPADDLSLVADLDSDGDPDILNVDVWWENARGAFEISHPFPYTGSIVLDRYGTRLPFVARDLDGDSDLDIVARPDRHFFDPGLPAIGWYENTGGGVFAPYGTLVATPTGSWPTYALVDVADVDGDGDGDLLYADDLHLWIVYENEGGTFVEIDAHARPAPGEGHLIAVDLGCGSGLDLLADHFSTPPTGGEGHGVYRAMARDTPLP